MKAAILGESDIDNQLVWRIVQGIRGTDISRVEHPSSVRSWPRLLYALPSVVKYLYYRTDADALIVIADSDKTEVHERGHDGRNQNCRHCSLQLESDLVRAQLAPVEYRGDLRVIVVVPPPSIEAWFSLGDANCGTEGAWRQALRNGAIASLEIDRLKRLLYDEAALRSSQRRLEHALQHADRLLARIDHVEAAFPDSFGRFVDTVRSWPK